MQPTVREVASEVHFVEASHTNFVLIGDGPELALVDTGYPRDLHLVESAVRQLGRAPSDLSALLLTHAHVDHLGSAERLRHQHGVPVRCHTAEAAHARGEVEEVISRGAVLSRAWRPQVLLFLVNVIAKGGLEVERVNEVTTFSGGEQLDTPGRPIVVHTPGHTSGHVAFHLPERGVLISGDALITVDVWNRSHRGPQVIRAPFNHDHRQAIDSLSRLAELDAAVILPGHGLPYEGRPADAVEQARRDL